MNPVPPLLALRLSGQDHALEPGRDYLLGSAEDCDLRLSAGVGPHHTCLSVQAGGAIVRDLGSPPGTLRNGQPVVEAPIAIGDVLRLGEHEAVVVADDGGAAIVPIPAFRAAATARKLSAIRIAAASLRHADEETLAEMFSGELRRAPWLAISLALHVMLLLLLWWLVPTPKFAGPRHASVEVQAPEVGTVATEALPTTPEVVVEPADTVPSELLDDPPIKVAELPANDVGSEPGHADFPQVNISLRGSGSSSGGGGGGGNSIGVGSGQFRQKVGELRQSGLEIVFVFDSTGSMSRTIADTKATIAEMLTVLRYLVPDASFGLVTYRDRGKREEYLVREVPLGADFWRPVNFMQFVTAEGGGDEPEDVRAGLRAAFEQHWRNGARRVVVLAGDAEPHAEDMQSLLAQVRSFVQDGHSFVHALVTAPAPAPTYTVAAFREIAKVGRGLCESIDDRQRVLQRVLSFAFGREFDQDLASVLAAVKEEQGRVDVRALAQVRHAGPQLKLALLEDPMPQTLWNALVRRPNRGAARILLELLTAKDTREPTRQAVAAALQLMLELPLPPIDPINGQPMTSSACERLRRAIDQLPE